MRILTSRKNSHHVVTYLIVPAVLSFEFMSTVLWKQSGYQDIFSKWILSPNSLGLFHNFLIIEPTRCTNSSKIYFEMKFYMFRTVPLSIIRSFTMYTQQWYMSYRFAESLWAAAYAPAHKLSANLYDIYHCSVYSEKLLMMDRGTALNM